MAQRGPGVLELVPIGVQIPQEGKGELQCRECSMGQDVPLVTAQSPPAMGLCWYREGTKSSSNSLASSCCSRARKLPEQHIPERFCLHSKQKAAALSSGSHRCCPHWSSLEAGARSSHKHQHYPGLRKFLSVPGLQELPGLITDSSRLWDCRRRRKE